jgi:REP element-mobilizing transposase RayT
MNKHKNLPHISKPGLYQFITFRTNDSTDEYILKLSLEKNIKTKQLQYQIDKHLDNSNKGAYLNADILKLTKEYLLNLDKDMCEVVAFSIMPNHIHLILIQKHTLSKIIQKIKGSLGFMINKKLNKSGTFWQKDYFDKAIRDDKHFEVVLEYVKNNAYKAGLSDADDRFVYVCDE